MTSDDVRNDALLDAVWSLAEFEPDAARVDRTRALCHAALGNHALLREAGRTRRHASPAALVRPAAFAFLCGFYLVDVFRRALSWWGPFTP